jgi:hypothetical protein
VKSLNKIGEIKKQKSVKSLNQYKQFINGVWVDAVDGREIS